MSGLESKSGVAKTTKLFIGGEFPRTESGRSYPVFIHGTKKIYAHLCLASRKDFRNSVTAAQSALSSWLQKSAYNRGQILYRMAEMMEGKRHEFVEILTSTLGQTKTAADKSVDGAIDALVYFAGWTDKYQQVTGSVNPVSGPHHNFTSPEPVGVVTYIPEPQFDLVQIVSRIAAIVASGNVAVVLMHEKGSATLSALAEVFATSDLPKGVINLLSGSLDELLPHIGAHMEVHAILCEHTKALAKIKELGAENMKRVHGPIPGPILGLEPVVTFVEYKTVWHPIGH